MASPTLSLPSGQGDREAAEPSRRRNLVPMGVLLLAGSGAMLFGTLIAAYLHLRRLTDAWPPEGTRIDQYLGNLLVITLLLSAVTVEWAYYALRRGERRQASAALGVTLGFGLAFLNLLSYTADRARFDAASHPYGLVVTAMAMLVGIVVGVGVAMVTLTLLRVTGGQVTSAEPAQLRATASYWHFTVAASVAVWYTVIVLK